MKTDVSRNWAIPSATDLLDLISSFRRWWVDEFRTLLANEAGRWLLGPQRRVLQLEATPDAVQFTLTSGEHDPPEIAWVAAADYSKSTLDLFLETRRLSRNDVDVTVRLPYDMFFCRQLQLPAEASRGLGDIVVRDMERKTSFRSDKVYHQHSVQRSSDSKKLAVWQWIIKRQFVGDALSLLQLDAADVLLIDAQAPSDETPSPLIVLQHDTPRERPWYWSSLRMLFVCFAILSLTAVGTTLWRQQSEIDDLEVQTASTRTKAQQVRAQIDRLEKKQAAIVRIRTEKSTTPGLLDLWERTTAILPSHSWLVEFQLTQSGAGKSEQQLSLTGFSEAAASLVGLFETSPIFKDATLTSPISVDPIESRERFSMQMKVRSAELGKTGAP